MNLKRVAREAYHRSQFLKDSVIRSKKPALVIYGNCQAEALRIILSSTTHFTEKYRVIRIPAAHLISRSQVSTLRRLLGRADVLVTQQIRDGYRGLPIGTDELATAFRGRVITYPVMFYRGLHPYLVYVHADGELGTQAPLTAGYHDLRIIAAAAAGMDPAGATKAVTQFAANNAFLDDMAHNSLAELERRERKLSVGISDQVASLGLSAFWTLNHPSNALLQLCATRITAELGLTGEAHHPERELLTDVVVPPSADVRARLGGDVTSAQTQWILNGQPTSLADIVAAHCTFYQDRPDVLSHALEEHAIGLIESGLTAAFARA